jgi:tRNA U34 2-thiouridine synthase MnmA/TrmU
MDERQLEPVRALGLCSGGLDSILAGLVLKDIGIQVEWVSFETPFFSADKARKAARIADIPLTVRGITPVYLEMLKNPRCGYGQHMNPCMDCHALMFRQAGRIMAERGFHFLFSGEVLGQRPMSQTRPSLRYVEKHSGHDGYILRPLSAKKLPETVPEKEGWVDRERLLDIAGRGRKRQIELAAHYGVTDYPAPAGGCLLTDKGYSRRLRDLLDHNPFPSDADLHLLKYGRHFRLDAESKIVVGRTKAENDAILRHFDPGKDIFIKVRDVPGPVVVMPGGGSPEAVRLAAEIAGSYSKAAEGESVNVGATAPNGREDVQVTIPPRSDIQSYLL